MAHAFDNHNASLSEGVPLAAVVVALPGKPYWTRVGTDSPRRLRQSWRGGARRVLASPGAVARRTRGVQVEGATLYFASRIGTAGQADVH